MIDLPGKPQKRDGTADILKGLAVLFMIQVHIMEQFASPDTYNSVIGKISMFLGGPPCAPVFLAVMGYFLASSGKSFTYFMQRGAFLFFGGILLNTARSANLLLLIMRGEVDLDPWFFILGADILTLAGITLILTGFLRMMFKDKTLLYFLMAIAVVAATPLLNQHTSDGSAAKFVIAFFWGSAAWSYFPVFPWFAYVLTGFAFQLFMKQSTFAGKIDIQNHFVYFIPVMIGLIITIQFATEISHNLTGQGGYYHHGILFFGWVLLFMISYLVLVKLLDISYGEHVAVRIIKWMGQKVTGLYVIQWLIIGNLATFFYRSQDLFQYLAWVVIMTFTAILINLLISKLWVGFKTRFG